MDIVTLSSAAQEAQSPKKILKMVKNERMGGYVPAWENPQTPKEKVAENLSRTLTETYEPETGNFANALIDQENIQKPIQKDNEFGFGDVIDMVNPLHHIPLVGSAYRHITGDQIKPIGKIIGGGLFGGPLGAASGLVNVIAQDSTGKDITDNAFSMLNNSASKTMPKPHIERLTENIPQREPITQMEMKKMPYVIRLPNS